MYLVTIVMHIHSGFSTLSTNDVWVERDVVMPFPPSIGLTYRESLTGFHHTFEEIVWDKELQAIVSYDTDRELYEEAASQYPKMGLLTYDNTDRLAEKVAEYESEGWTRRDR